ncbi:unnamed protein product [Prorocentrum cordatum]|uniref:Secreted protein n=1 Tax=Prorocentrum cordatum TaxID=2364126 RepID=A0ABN9PI58_9DINO|nr:unnamed protein product [Polarella glacialis]
MSARGARVPSLLLACLPLCHHRSGSQVRREARAPSRMQRVPRDVRPVRAERRRLAPCLHSSAAAAYPSAVSAAILWHRPALDSDVLRPQLAGAPCALFFWAYHARAAWLQVHLVFFEFPTDASICLTLAPGGVVQHRPGGSAPRPVWRFGCPRGLSGGHARRRSSEGCQPCARALGSTELESRTCHVGAPSPSSSARLLLRLWSTASLHPRYPCPPLLQKTQAAESLGRGRHLGSTRSVPWSLCAASCPPASAGLQHEQCILENNRAGAGGRWRWTCFRQAAASSPQALRGSVRSCLPTSRQVPDTRFPCSESPRVFDEPGGSAFKPFLALSAGTCETITHGFSIPGDPVRGRSRRPR